MKQQTSVLKTPLIIQNKRKTSVKVEQKRPSKREPVQREVSAGGIVFRSSGNCVSFAVMKDSYGKWTFHKVHVEQWEDLEEAAARETLE